ncbi:CBS domain-containing protein [uncultured Selenomonas sp.]|uniref:CBS domain-containing protein n=1 Tax=uncultured Selenomonas sp. TaxID=159275 RepID=UPI0025FF8EAE|nr:CBS domain-containing protein [uncultured Selenomonas sp.]
MQVQDIMTKKVLTVRPETTVREVAEILVNHKISGVPVVEDDGRLVGIVSEGDLMSKEILGAVIYYNGLREYKDAFDRMAANTAAALMTKKVVTVKAYDDISDVARIMRDKHIKRVPVLDDEGHLIGIVSRQDIVKMLL